MEKKFKRKHLKKQSSNNAVKAGKRNQEPQLTHEHDKMIVQKVWEIAGSICEAEQIELVYVQYQREPSGRILRVYIDKPGGVNLNDCVYISRQLSDVLDIYLDNENPYNLEVSSPGTDRPLGRLQDFERYKGNMVKIKTARAIDGQKNFKGILLGVLDNNVKLQAHGNKNMDISFTDIVKARLVDYSGETSCS